LELKILTLGKFEGKIEILSTHNLCGKFAVVCRRIATSCPCRNPRRRYV